LFKVGKSLLRYGSLTEVAEANENPDGNRELNWQVGSKIGKRIRTRKEGGGGRGRGRGESCGLWRS
jgi:hypothetical protein